MVVRSRIDVEWQTNFGKKVYLVFGEEKYDYMS
jgi:hypothetical protein